MRGFLGDSAVFGSRFLHLTPPFTKANDNTRIFLTADPLFAKDIFEPVYVRTLHLTLDRVLFREIDINIKVTQGQIVDMVGEGQAILIARNNRQQSLGNRLSLSENRPVTIQKTITKGCLGLGLGL